MHMLEGKLLHSILCVNITQMPTHQVLDVEPGVAVTLRITSPATVNFFASCPEARRDKLAGMAARCLDALATGLSQLAELEYDSVSKNKSERLEEYLQGMEARLRRDFQASMRTGLDHELITSAVTGCVQRWFDAELACLREGHMRAQHSLSDLQSGVREELQTILERHNQVTHLRAREASLETRDQVRDAIERLKDQQRDDIHAVQESMRMCMQQLQRVCECNERALDTSNRDQVLAEKFARVPDNVQAALSDVLARLECRTGRLTDGLARLEDRASGNSVELSLVVQGVKDLLQHHTRFTSHVGLKGRVGEQRLYDLLCDALPSRDGFDVYVVSGVAHACDMVVKRPAHPDVRIESKAYGAQAGNKVSAREVAKFRDDLAGLDAHGIMVSLHSGIAGRPGLFEIEQLSNGKFAIYLSNNEYDISTIVSMVHLLYRLEKVASGGGSEDERTTLRVPPHVIQSVRMYLKDFAVKISHVKTQMKNSLALLNEVTLDLVERILTQQQQTTSNSNAIVDNNNVINTHDTNDNNVKQTFSCPTCGKQCKRMAGLLAHQKTHEQKNHV